MATTTQATAEERETRFHGCPSCRKRRKMRILRALDDTRLEWLNCNACNSIVCLGYDDDSEEPTETTVVGDFGEPAPETFRTYVPEESYELGEFIYHQTWRDIGKVIRRREMAGGRSAIEVAFLNSGLKILIVEAESLAR